MSQVDETLKLIGGLALITLAIVLVLHFTVGWFLNFEEGELP